MKKWLSILFVLLLVLLTACGEGGLGGLLGGNNGDDNSVKTESGLELTPGEDGGYVLSGSQDCKDTHVVIPAEFDGKPVTAIGRDAFINSRMTAVTIPDSVAMIDRNAFASCPELTELDLGKGLKEIELGAFSNCFALEEITIPDSVTVIGSEAFRNCQSLKSVHFGNGVSLIDGAAFDGCEALTQIDLPASLREIGYNAFHECTNLKTVNIAGGLEKIGAFAFSECPALEEIVLPDSVTFIDDYAFTRCANLKSAVIGNGVETMGRSIFYNSPNLESLTIPFVGAARVPSADTPYPYPLGYIFGTEKCDGFVKVSPYGYGTDESPAKYTYYYLPEKLSSVTVTGGVIFDGAFYNCSMLKTVTLGDGFTQIGDRAFENCTSLISVRLPEGITSIGECGFYYCPALTDINIPSSVKFIDYGAFLYSDSLKFTEYEGGFYLGNSSNPYVVAVKSNYAAAGIHPNTQIIMEETFASNMMDQVIIPGNVTHMGTGAFQHSGISSVVIPESITVIEWYTFQGCYNLTTITVPASVTEIREGAFYWCDVLTQIRYGGTMAQWNAIEKENCWGDSSNVNCTIVCTDGSLTYKSGGK